MVTDRRRRDRRRQLVLPRRRRGRYAVALAARRLHRDELHDLRRARHPTVRFFAKRQSGGWLSLSTLRVDVLFETSTGSVASLPIGSVGSGGSWQATSPMLVVANLLPLLPGERTPIAFRFTAQGSANWSIDDVWVDPYSKK